MNNPNLVILAGGISSRMKRPISNPSAIDKKLIEDADKKSKSMIGVGNGYRPFLDYLLFNAKEAGYKDILIVIGENDDSIKNYYGEKDSGNNFNGLTISYAVQKIDKVYNKPLGTADALQYALEKRSDWSGQKFTVCNSDNLYSIKALKIMLNSPYPGAFIDYNRAALEFELSRIETFAVTKKSKEGFLLDIIEKPGASDIEKVKDEDGNIGVSMNLFRLDYDSILPILKRVPLDTAKNEKYLPIAVKILAAENPDSVFAYPLSEHVPDLTNKSDIKAVQSYLENNFKNFKFGSYE